MAKHHPDLIFCRKQPGVGECDLTSKFLNDFLTQCEILILTGIFSRFLRDFRCFSRYFTIIE